MLLTDTISLLPGTVFDGAGGVANYANAKTKIKFQPATKRDVFNWASAPSDYVFDGVTLIGFTIRGFGAGASACLDLPLLYNGEIDFFAFSGIDAWLRVKKWLDCDVRGGCQGFAFFGVEFAKSGVGTSAADVTTSTTFDAYISQGPKGYVAQNNSATNAKIRGVVESVDSVLDMAQGNVLDVDLYTENAPRTDTGAAFLVGKSGTAGATSTALHLNLQPGVGYTGGSLVNSILLDIDAARFVRLSGYAYLYAALLKTTTNTQRVLLTALDTDNCSKLSLSGGITDIAAITTAGFRPRNMITDGDGFFSEYPLAGPSLEMFAIDRAAITRRKLALDAWTGKLRRRDAQNNLSQPIGYLETTATSGWTFNGAKLTPGELVVHATSDTGQVALWRSQRHSQDSAVSVLGNTNAGTGVIGSSGTPGRFASINVNDWVTVSAGYGSATFQRRVVSKSADESQITLDTNASSTQVNVTIATEAHQLVPIAQQGYRQAATAPGGIVTPKYIGEEYFDTAGVNWYKSTGLTNTDWKLIS